MFFSLSLYQLGQSTGSVTLSVPSTTSACTWTGWSMPLQKQFSWHNCFKPCTTRHTTTCLTWFIEKADPVKLPHPQMIWKYVAMLQRFHEVSLPGSGPGCGAVEVIYNLLLQVSVFACGWLPVCGHEFTSFIHILLWYWTIQEFLIPTPLPCPSMVSLQGYLLEDFIICLLIWQ